MILFESDWDKYPLAIIDDSTVSNISFLSYALWLKDRGIKNWKWPIALLNPELKGKNPFDAGLSNEEMTLFVLEFKMNPWTYFRLACKTPDMSSFVANSWNMALLWLCFNDINVCLKKPSQVGKTVSMASLDTYLNNIRNTDSVTLWLSSEKDNPLHLIDTLHTRMPRYIQQQSTNSRDLNTRSLHVHLLNNRIRARHVPKRLVLIENLSKGMSINNLRIDGVENMPCFEEMLTNIYPSMFAAQHQSSQAGNTYGNIFAANGDKLDNSDHKYAKQFFDTCVPFDIEMFDRLDKTALDHIVTGGFRGQHTSRVLVN